jgi:hypothetical protein
MWNTLIKRTTAWSAELAATSSYLVATHVSCEDTISAILTMCKHAASPVLQTTAAAAAAVLCGQL